MACSDKNCPIHSGLKTRGAAQIATVTSTKPKNTVIVRRDYLVKKPKYERYLRRKSKIAAHKPKCMDIKEGDKVEIAECRPISKTKHFTVTKKIE